MTVFRTVVKDRFISNVVISSPPPPGPIVISVTNGLDAHISGLELEAEQRLGPRVGVFANTTHYFNRKERLASGLQQDILNVPTHTVRGGVDVDLGPISARLSGRYVHGRKDNDFNQPGFPIVDYDDVTIVDATVTWRAGATARGGRGDQQRVRRVLLREDRLPAAGRVVRGCRIAWVSKPRMPRIATDGHGFRFTDYTDSRIRIRRIRVFRRRRRTRS